MDEHPYIRLARDAIRHYSQMGESLRLEAEPDDPPPSGVFVSLHEAAPPGQTEGPLRGCIGTYEPRERNIRTEIARSAVAAAFSDPRFPPLRSEEVDRLDITVYLLAEPEPIDGIADLDPARYGVIVESGGRRGLLLPAIPGITTADQQLAIAMNKAGIYSLDEAILYRFGATIIK